MNLILLLEIKASLPWLASKSLGNWFFVAYIRSSTPIAGRIGVRIGARIGSPFTYEIRYSKKRQSANGLGVRSSI